MELTLNDIQEYLGQTGKKEGDEVKKWLLAPLPQAEINKKYGLVQNPGWE